MEKITVIFEGGIANDGVHACNYMLARTEDADGDPIELYSEVSLPENLRDDEVDAFDAATYPILKEDIINQAIDAGIDANQLVFPYGASCPEPDNVVYVDGKLLYLDNDAEHIEPILDDPARNHLKERTRNEKRRMDDKERHEL